MPGSREEHAAKEQLAALEKMNVGAPEFIDALTRLRDDVLKHAVQEEDEEFRRRALRVHARPGP